MANAGEGGLDCMRRCGKEIGMGAVVDGTNSRSDIRPTREGREKKKIRPLGDILPKLTLWMFPVSQNPIIQVRI